MRATCRLIQLLPTDHYTLRFFIVTPSGNILNDWDLCQRVRELVWRKERTFSDAPPNVHCVLRSFFEPLSSHPSRHSIYMFNDFACKEAQVVKIF
jgi:hypothetical protein